ncbi:MAG: TIGR02680 family protein [Bifidobacteriaceae bacterium]|nr:TIGR02680 family protein [Bifidobacteriaceae bacterium]
MEELNTELPQPSGARWEPLRLGLVNLYYYDEEQFWFRGGRLLLRGNNGTGKSKVLALTLPFLLDGHLAPARLEPDADRSKRMEWNLLLQGTEDYEERTGYSWVEFGRIDAASGVPEYFTLGCGLKAVRGRGITRHWFFTTGRRIGDLKLVDPAAMPLSRERLREEVTQDGLGQLFENDLDGYRRAIDDKLFKLGRERYETLIDLLIQLRQPQLSIKPNEAKLAEALTNSRPPLAREVLADLAESFRALDEDKQRVEELDAIQRAVKSFMREHRRYAQAQSRIRAQDVRRAHSAYEELGRELVGEREAVKAAEQRIIDLEAADRTGRLDLAKLAARRETLQESTAWGEAHDLERAGKAAAAAREACAQALSARDRAGVAADQADGRATAALQAAAEATAEADAARSASLAAADLAGLAEYHDPAVADRVAADQALRRRSKQADHVADAVSRAQEARQRAAELRRVADAAEAEAAQRRAAREAADTAAREAGEALLAACEGYLAGLEELAVEDQPGALTRVERWAGDPEGWEFPLAEQLRLIADEALTRVARQRAELEAALDEADQELTKWRGELAGLEAGAAPIPERRPTRRAVDQAEAARPLYELVEFADNCDAASRAGLEAALEAAGLLDALIRPDGSVLDPASGDLLLAPSAPGAALSPSWPTLDGVLVPDPAGRGDLMVPQEVVRQVLGSIGLGCGSGPVWVAFDGSYGLGSAMGRWDKPEAQFVGAAARERQRLAAIAAAQVRVAEIEATIAGLNEAIAAVRRRARRIKAERDGTPTQEPLSVLRTADQARAAAREQAAAETGAASAASAAAMAFADAATAQDVADQAGQDLGIEPSVAGVAALREALATLNVALERTRGAVRRATELEAGAAQARQQAEERAEELTERRAAYDRAELAKAEAEARFDALNKSVGAAVAELKAELTKVEADTAEARRRLEEVTQERMKANVALGSAQATLEQLTARRDDATGRRDEAFERLRRFAATSLLRIALPDQAIGQLDSAAAVVGLARSAEAALTNIPIDPAAMDACRRKNSAAVNELRSELAVYAHALDAVEQEDGEEVRVRYGEREIGPDELAQQVATALADRQRMLSARERAILENYLMSDTADQLAELMIQADAWVKELNRELAGRATSTGMKIRLRWQARPDAPLGFEQVRALLLRSGAVWNEAERGLIGEFLQRAIEAQRAEVPEAGWDEHLSAAFDYRRWHTFKIERSQGANWVSGAGPASTGERALTLTLPLFAAAASYYTTARNAAAPRLILLDEAFAGIDNEGRAGAMGLFAAFDLDAVMTSEREWGCYPTVPSLSICHLNRREGVNAVHVSRWSWDGAGKTAAAPPPSQALAWAREAP